MKQDGEEFIKQTGIPEFSLGKVLEGILLALVILLALALRLWNMDQIGWGAPYYSAAVRSMSMSWHNFLYTAFDPAGFISVDKPPLALWFQVAFVKYFGFKPLSLLLPQILEGVAAVWVLYCMVRRYFGVSAGLLSALFFAIMPIWVAVNRTNNMDTCLVLALLLAGWALLIAIEKRNMWPLLLSAVLIGLAFNVKMLAAYIVLPVFCVAYFLGTRRYWGTRLSHLFLAGLIVAATSLPWVLMYETTPVEKRPFVGGSRTNSMLELIVGHNAANRFTSPLKYIQDSRSESDDADGPPEASSPEIRSKGEASNRLDQRLFVRVPPGSLRLLDGKLAAQTAWFLPLAIAAMLGFRSTRWRRLGGRQISLIFWLGWTCIYAVVYSALGGIIHYYYLATMAPALAALAGIGIMELWTRFRDRDRTALLLPAVLLLTAVWQLWMQGRAIGWDALDTGWQAWLHLTIFGGTVLGSAALIILLFRKSIYDRWFRPIGAGFLAIVLLVLLAAPSAWALSSVLPPVYNLLPSAELNRLIPISRISEARSRALEAKSSSVRKLIGFLKSNRSGERYLLSTSTAQVAAPVIIGTGDAVMARGGFHGLDPAITPEKLDRMVRSGDVRFIMTGDLGYVQKLMGAVEAGKPVSDWVAIHGRPVDPALWKSKRFGSIVQLYDLRPEKGLH